jgi:hypothetical protein
MKNTLQCCQISKDSLSLNSYYCCWNHISTPSFQAFARRNICCYSYRIISPYKAIYEEDEIVARSAAPTMISGNGQPAPGDGFTSCYNPLKWHLRVPATVVILCAIYYSCSLQLTASPQTNWDAVATVPRTGVTDLSILPRPPAPKFISAPPIVPDLAGKEDLAVNNDCVDAIPLSFGVPVEGTNEDSEFDFFNAEYCGANSSLPGVWYRVAGGSDKPCLKSSVCTTNGVLTRYSIITECTNTPEGTCLGFPIEFSVAKCEDDESIDYSWESKSGVGYYIQIRSELAERTNFSVTVVQSECVRH